MKIFLDTANTQELKKAAETGILDGCTTNPTLIMKEGRDYVKTLKEITKIVNGPISAETVSLDAKGMIKEGKKFAKPALLQLFVILFFWLFLQKNLFPLKQEVLFFLEGARLLSSFLYPY